MSLWLGKDCLGFLRKGWEQEDPAVRFVGSVEEGQEGSWQSLQVSAPAGRPKSSRGPASRSSLVGCRGRRRGPEVGACFPGVPLEGGAQCLQG